MRGKAAAGSLVLLLGIAALPPAAAEAVVTQMDCPAGGCGPALPAGGELLWSQLDDPSGSGFIDQEFEFGKGNYSAEAGDDFIVTASGWDIATVYTPGTQSFGTFAEVEYVSHFYYADAGGLPGAPIAGCEFPANTQFVDDSGSITTVTPCHLAAGAHWFSQSVRQDITTSSQHFWATRANANVNPAVWRNPNGGFGIDCIDWMPANAVCGMIGEDFLFELQGSAGAGPPVPAVGPVGGLLLALALGAAGAYVLRRPDGAR